MDQILKSTINQEIIPLLIDIVGENGIKIDADSLDLWGKDSSKHFSANPLLIIFPSSTEEVQQIIKIANNYTINIVPSGGRTGLSAGAVANNGELVISMDKMNQVIQFYPGDRMVHVQAGMITEELQNWATAHGLYYPVDFASSGSSHVGGNIATNAGGIKVIRYGMTRDWILGLTVVTGNGDILHLNNGMIKNATGYPLHQLLIGSEGTLGIITEAWIKLTRPPQNLNVMVLGVEDFPAVMAVLQSFQQDIDLTAFEFFDSTAMNKVLAKGLVQQPFETHCRFYVLLEFEAPFPVIIDQALEKFEYCMEQGWVLDGVISQNIEQAKNLWRLREDISETIAEFTPYKNDISVLITYLPEFIQDIETIINENYPEFEICWFGHIGDGNLHLNILKPSWLDKKDFFEQCKTVNDKVFNTVKKYQGSISAEHGVGMTKKPYLHYTRSKQEIDYLRRIKQVFDPNHLINPGKIFD